MKNTNKYWLTASVLAFTTAIIHLYQGQLDLINPLLESELSSQIKTELLGVWHMISLLLLATAGVYLFFAIKNLPSSITLCLLSNLYFAFGLVFIGVSLFTGNFAPQFILLIPIGFFGLIGIKKHAV